MEHSTNNFGNLIAERQFKASASFWFRFGGAVALGLIAFGGIYLIFDPIVDSDTPTRGLIALGAAALLILFMLLLARTIKSAVAIYEEGVVVTKGKKLLPYHYNQILGLDDTSVGGMVFMSGGLIGAVVTGAVTAVASKAIGAIDRNYRIRAIDIIPTPDSQLKKVGVVNTGGDILSHVYSEWVIKQKGITAENANAQELHFGDLSLKDGVFTHKRLRGDEVHARLDDVMGMDIEEDHLRLLGENQVGKQVALIKINTSFVVNMDLLVYVVNLQYGTSDSM
ncbi:MAG: hypothetical protein FWE42_06425 [Defluviitaleaceae bacterium]|nr:hypothetical protein [Defluviitaleaceae bacterium]